MRTCCTRMNSLMTASRWPSEPPMPRDASRLANRATSGSGLPPWPSGLCCPAPPKLALAAGGGGGGGWSCPLSTAAASTPPLQVQPGSRCGAQAGSACCSHESSSALLPHSCFAQPLKMLRLTKCRRLL